MRQLTAIALLLLAILTMPCMHSTAFAELDADKSFETDIKEFLPHQIDKGLELAKRYIAMERFDLAERFYKTMFDSKPIDWRVYYYYSDFLIRLNRIKEAVEVLETCTEERGISAYDIHITLGALYFRDQNYRKSAREYKRAASVNHIYPEPLFYWAVSAIFQGLEGEPTEAIQTMEKRFPGSPYLAFAKAVYAYYSGKFEEADALVATITDDSTMPAFYHVFRSALFIQSGRLDQAKQSIAKAVSVDPLCDGALTNQAIVTLLTDKNPANIDKALQGAAKYEAFQELRLAMAFHYMQIGSTEEARKVIGQLLEERRNLYYANYLMAVIVNREITALVADKAMPEADRKAKLTPLIESMLEYLRVCISAGGKDFFAAHFLLGKAFFAQEDYDKALESFQTAVKLAPKNTMVQIFVGHCYLKLGKLNEAKRSFEAVAQIEDKNTHALNCLGYIAAVTGNTAQAEEYFNTVLNISKNDRYANDQIKRLKELEKQQGR